jgi:hypothetical protein
MSAVSRSRRRLRDLVLWAAPVAWLGCGGGSGTDIVLPALTVTTATSGVELDSDGYSLTVDGTPPQAIGLNATATVDQLSEGAHTATLSGLAANCTAAGNPRSFTIQAGVTTSVDFAVTCAPSRGTIQVTTTTSGPGSDPDGFTLLLDGTDEGIVAVSGSASLSEIPSGDHMVGLAGLAANCQVAGDNPRSVTVAAGQTTAAPFSVTCDASVPTAGTLEITTATSGSNQPPGYSVSLDGAAGQPIGVNATVALANVPAGQRTVELLDVPANCTVAGTTSAQATVPAGGAAQLTFTVTCVAPPPNTGGVQVTATTTGSSLDDGYTVSVDGGNSQAITRNGTVTVGGLTAGTHNVRLGGVATNCSVTGNNPLTVTVTAGQTSSAPFAITCATTGPSVNLSIEGLYLTQSTQTLSENVPLVQDRAAYLRVFAKADRATTVRPTVRVRFFSNGSVIRTLTLAHSGFPTPTALAEGTLTSSWNGAVDASLIQPGVSILADVDPGNTVPESNETDNSFPASGTPLGLNVHAVSVAKIHFVPIRQGDGEPGNVTAANKDALIETARRIYPLHSIDTDVGAVYSTSIVLQPDGGATTWGQLLTDLDVQRIMDGSDRTYYGVVKLGYSGGIVGLGFVGAPSAIGTDNPADMTRVVAHELGHTWGQFHTPCGNPPLEGIDPNYPYGNGIGVYGFDVTTGSLKPPSTPDIMGYCSNPWISDYIYTRVLNFRETHPAATQGASAAKEPTVLVWGRIVHGQAVLEPAFQVVTRPSLPAKPGPYSVEGVATDGASLFRLSFDATEVADDPSGSRHFAFAVPLDQARAVRLGSLRLTGPAGAATAISPRVGALRQAVAPDTIVARREPGRVALEWNVQAHPMIMVRDPDTGEILSFARGGKARVVTSKAKLDLVVSDGVQSHTIQVTPR